MKPYIAFTTFILVVVTFFACKKDLVDLLPPDTNIPDPSDTTIQRNFKLVFINLSGNWNGSESLTANVAIENPQTPDKQINLTFPVLFESQSSSPVVKLPKGSYKIERLMINDAAGKTRFATPLTGSPKAGQINKPLSVSMVLEEKVEKEVRLEVLPVTTTDTPQSFGYPADAFGKTPGDPQPPMDKRVFVRARIKVGEVDYDYIPAQLIVKSWDAKGEMDYKIHYLAAGEQGIYLSAKAVRFQLSVSKWGAYSELALTQAEVQENAVYDMKGTVAARKLKSVVETRIAGGKSTPQTKTDYEYHENGEIKQRLVWGKRVDQTTYLAQKEVFSYTNGNITSIQVYDENNALLKKLTARYDTEKRVIALEESKGVDKITITASYIPLELESQEVIEDYYRIDAKYEFSTIELTDYYSKIMSRGKVVHDNYVAGNGIREEGTYDYDFSINPYVHLRIPDQLFTQYTKHNLVFPRKIRRGGFIQNEPYDYKYLYDAHGYPKEVMVKYRSVETKKDTYDMRTVFSYN